MGKGTAGYILGVANGAIAACFWNGVANNPMSDGMNAGAYISTGVFALMMLVITAKSLVEDKDWV